MTTVVTGATGFLGSSLVHVLLKRQQLGYEPKVDLREGIRLAAAWFNAGGMEQPLISQTSQDALSQRGT